MPYAYKVKKDFLGIPKGAILVKAGQEFHHADGDVFSFKNDAISLHVRERYLAEMDEFFEAYYGEGVY